MFILHVQVVFLQFLYNAYFMKMDKYFWTYSKHECFQLHVHDTIMNGILWRSLDPL